MVQTAQRETTGDSPLIQSIERVMGKAGPRMQKLLEARRAYEAMSDEEREAIAAKDAAELEAKTREGVKHMAWLRSGLEESLWTRTLDTYPVIDPGQHEAVKLARLFVERFPGTPVKPMHRGLYLHGEPGRGKSGLMHCVVTGVLSKPKLYRVLYIPCAEIDRIGQTLDIEHAALEADLVVWDDIEKGLQVPGTKFTPPSDAIIRRSINRADRVRKTIHCATSNFPIAKFKQAWPAFGSRLMGLMHECEVKGQDMRAEQPSLEKHWWSD